MRLKSLGQWKENDPDNQIMALQAKVETLTPSINSFKLAKDNAKLVPKDMKKPNAPVKPKADDHPTWTPKEDDKEIIMYKGGKWKYCKTCHNGEGTWNKTHVTLEHDTLKSTCN